MTKPREPLVRQLPDRSGEMARVSVPLTCPQAAMAVWGTYKDFRRLVAYVLTDDAKLAIQIVKQMGYVGLEWQVELVTLLPPHE